MKFHKSIIRGVKEFIEKKKNVKDIVLAESNRVYSLYDNNEESFLFI